MTINEIEKYSCRSCGEYKLRQVSGYEDLVRITSDCRPFNSGGQLTVCDECGAVQKIPSVQWLSDIEKIYANYDAYYQSGGVEQVAFDVSAGRPRRRSDVLIDNLARKNVINARGALLDVGCGNGATLSSFGESFPKWRLNGFELDDANIKKLEGIPGFQKLYVGEVSKVDESFDLVTMIHSLEHFVDPFSTLSDLRRSVCSQHLFVEVCNVRENPFDILVADHLMHFSPDTLSSLVERSGFSVLLVETKWVSKEISLLARVKEVCESDGKYLRRDCGESQYRKICQQVDWLKRLVEKARIASEKSIEFGIFGTSISGTWLASQLLDDVKFFVDEDESRIGRRHLGRPVFSPNQVPNNAVVFIALAPIVANAVAARLDDFQFELIVPESFAG